jgi:hypothetical protein
MSVWRDARRVIGVLLLALVSAAPSSTQGRTPAAVLDLFDLRPRAAVQAKLPNGLLEVSGLAVTADGRVFAHGDERGVVAQVDACAAKVIKAFALGKPPLRADFEGIAIAGERFFLITSKGFLYEFREGPDGAAVPFSVIDTGFGKVCELEGLAYDAGERTLLSGCKETARPELRGKLVLLRWSLDRKAPAATPNLTIPLNDVVKATGTKGFRTTSIERDALTGHYILVAGPERAIVELTTKGAVVAGRGLNRQLHTQPEGVTLVGDSILVIADEGGTQRGAMTCYRRAR